LGARLFALLLALGLGLLAGCSHFPKLTIIPDPLSGDEHLRLGQAYESQGQLDLAEREYRASLPLPGGYLALANLYYGREGDRDSQRKAEEYYRRALVSAPSPEAANNLAWLYLKDGRLLKVAERLALRAIVEGLKANMSPQAIDAFKDTLYQIRSAQLAKYQADLAARARPPLAREAPGPAGEAAEAGAGPKAKGEAAAADAEKAPKAKGQSAAAEKEAEAEKKPKAKGQPVPAENEAEKKPNAKGQPAPAENEAEAEKKPNAKGQPAPAAEKAEKSPKPKGQAKPGKDGKNGQAKAGQGGKSDKP
jgi:hypothetical protein